MTSNASFIFCNTSGNTQVKQRTLLLIQNMQQMKLWMPLPVIGGALCSKLQKCSAMLFVVKSFHQCALLPDKARLKP